MDMFWLGVVLYILSFGLFIAAVMFWSNLYVEAYNLGFNTYRDFVCKCEGKEQYEPSTSARLTSK